MFDEIDAKITEYRDAKSANPKRWRYAADKPGRKSSDPEDGVISQAKALAKALEGRLTNLRELV